MYALMTTFVDRLDALPADKNVIAWGCPVPFFGDLNSARVATVGINPSSREFIDECGQQLDPIKQRLPTLDSLGLARWADAEASHLREIINACTSYFHHNPYDRWFRVLERMLAPARVTLYGRPSTACHLDLVPFATRPKWGLLSRADRKQLLVSCDDALGLLIRDSTLDLLVLNGQSVVDYFETLAGASLERTGMPEWTLQRGTGRPVRGVSYSGAVSEVGGVPLPRPIRVVGYNHNLQSSFGVTRPVLESIGSWVKAKREQALR